MSHAGSRPVFRFPSSSDRALVVSSLAQSPVSSLQASLSVNDITRSGATRAAIHLTGPPISEPRSDSRGSRLLPKAPTRTVRGLLETSTLSNRSCPRMLPPVQLTTQCRLLPHPLIRTLNPMAAPVVHNQHLTFMLCITMVEAPQSPSSLAAVVLRNSLPHISADPKINLPTSPPLVVPTTPTPPTGDPGLVPHHVNLNLDSSDRFISSKTWLGGARARGVWFLNGFI